MLLKDASPFPSPGFRFSPCSEHRFTLRLRITSWPAARLAARDSHDMEKAEFCARKVGHGSWPGSLWSRGRFRDQGLVA